MIPVVCKQEGYGIIRDTGIYLLSQTRTDHFINNQLKVCCRSCLDTAVTCDCCCVRPTEKKRETHERNTHERNTHINPTDTILYQSHLPSLALDLNDRCPVEAYLR